MRRRAFVAIAAAVAIGPAVGLAQQSRVRTIGVLVIGKPDPAPLLHTFREQLAMLGYFDGQNVRIVVRSAQGDLQRLPELAAALAHEQVDVVATWMTPAVLAAKQATNSIPIVMIGAADPVGMGIVANPSFTSRTCGRTKHTTTAPIPITAPWSILAAHAPALSCRSSREPS
jgi:putative ABC transport system substrate-binding protein